MKNLFLATGAVCFFLSTATSSEKVATVTKLVVSDQSTPLSPYLFGQFLERPSWAKETGPESLTDANGDLPAPVIEMLADLSAPALRFPGGTDVDYMDWTDMIDNAPGRVGSRPTSLGKDKNSVTNRFGLHEYFDLLGKIGQPETALAVNLRDALYKVRPLDEAARHAAGLIAYVNARVGAVLPAKMPDWPALRAANGHPAPWKARWVSLGNETYFFWPPNDPAERARLGVESDEAAWAWYQECIIAYADAIRAVDLNVHLILDNLHDPWRPDGENAVSNKYRDAMIRHPEIRRRISHLTSHHYSPLDFWSCRQHGKDVKIDSLSQDDIWQGLVIGPGLFGEDGQSIAFGNYFDEYSSLGYKLAVTEWNWNSYRTKFKYWPFSLHVPATLGTAGFLNGLIRHASQVELATQSMLLGTAWGIAAIRADPTGEKLPYWQPQGQVAWLYRKNHGNRVLESRLENAPCWEHPPQFAGWFPEAEKLSQIDAVVTANDDTVFLHVINRSQNDPQTLSVTLPPTIQSKSDHSPKTWRRLSLTGSLLEESPRSVRPPVEEVNGPLNPDGTMTITLPPHSVSVILLTLRS